jgi:hypothetical protein
MLVQARLSQVDTGFTVMSLTANRDLPELLEELLEEYRGKLEGLLIHFSGYLAVKPDRGPALLLDGARMRAFPVSRLRASVSQAALHALAIMDVVAVADGDANTDLIAETLGISLNETTPHIAVLASVALPENLDLNRRGCTRLTDLWLLSLDYQAEHAHDSLVYSGSIVHGLQSERIAFASLPSFNYQPSDQDFLIMPGPQVGGFSGGSPAINASTQRSFGVRPPGSETDPASLVAPLAVRNHQDTNPDDDTLVDSGPATQVTDADIVHTEELPTIPPPIGRPTFNLSRPIPTPPKLDVAINVGQPLRSEPEWVANAAYLPSAPPPTVHARIPIPSPLSHQDQQATLPGISGPPSFAGDGFNEFVDDLEVVALLEHTLTNEPRHLPSLRALSDAAQRQNDFDSAALASAVLICLDSGRPEDEVRSAWLATDGLPLAQRTLNDDDYEELLLSKGADVSILRVLGQLTNAAVEAGLLAKSGYEELPKDATVLDPESSTVTVARSLAWAANFVSVATPELAMVPELPTQLELTVDGIDRLLISKQMGSGLSLAQLAFLGARHLSMLRPEFKWRAALDSAERLGSLIGHCVLYAREGSDFVKSVEDSERKAAKRFLSLLEAEEALLGRATDVFGSLELDRTAWTSLAYQLLIATDRVLLRNGLLACASPAVAWQLTLECPLRSPLSVDEQLDEIARFTTSRGHLTLRKSLGLAVGERRVV